MLFDIDGTLVDSNYLHVHAWTRAFAEEGIPVEAWRIHRCIGMDGTQLLQSLSGDADEDAQKRVKDRHLRYLKESAPLLRRLPGARELLEQIRSRGLQVVLASSSSEEELALSLPVLDCDDLVAATTSSKDVDVAKPEPTIIEVALDRAGVDADRAVYVGDAVWDIVACGRAGVRAIGLLSGGVSAAELEKAGAEAVFENPGDLADHLDDTSVAALTA
ncbi:HAD family hydrolase [Mycobacterium sp. 1274761.0]|uniref:HAD family hydrolase n=1 Tax=Mycobacterium sp. 1274761.0 TaxID=1834077 RepID=UPI0007FECD8C|nr:HAD family hydrolase [Mycobacterium sp. 1274761.0]OBK78671.1 HAD family hydrolase [Mycobacterium sp. 1274761.0]